MVDGDFSPKHGFISVFRFSLKFGETVNKLRVRAPAAEGKNVTSLVRDKQRVGSSKDCKRHGLTCTYAGPDQ